MSWHKFDSGKTVGQEGSEGEKFFWMKNTNLAQGLRLKKSAHFSKGILRLLVKFTVG